MTGPDPTRPPDGSEGAAAEQSQTPATPGSGQAPPGAEQSQVVSAGVPEFRDYRNVWGPSGQPPAPKPPPKARPWGRWSLYALAFMAVAALAFDIASRAPDETTLPPSVIGKWHTDAPRYASRQLELQAGSVIVQAGEPPAMVKSHRIVRVQQSPSEDGGTLFRVDYVEDEEAGTETTLEFIYRPAPRSEIVLAHQKEMVWTRGPIPAKPPAPATVPPAAPRVVPKKSEPRP